MEDNFDSLVNQEVFILGQFFFMFLKEKLEGWLVFIKIVFDKKVQKISVFMNIDNLMRIFIMGIDFIKLFEYFFVIGNLCFKIGFGFL